MQEINQRSYRVAEIADDSNKCSCNSLGCVTRGRDIMRTLGILFVCVTLATGNVELTSSSVLLRMVEILLIIAVINETKTEP